MKKYSYTIKDRMGIHIRPAGLFVKEVQKYESKVTIFANGKTADASNLVMIMSLGVKKGETIEIEIEGPDEDAAYDRIVSFFENNL